MRGPVARPWRPDLFVLARFLERLWHGESEPAPRWSKSRLQPAVRLNYDLFQKYLSFLLDQQMVVIENGRAGEQLIRLAPKGRQAHARLVAWIRDVFGEQAFRR